MLAQFDEQSRSLRRLTLFFLVPGLVFGVFVFLPFTQQVSSATRLEAELDSARTRLDATADSLPAIAAVDSLLDALSPGPRLRRELDFRVELAIELERTGAIDADTLALWTSGQADVDVSDVGERLWPEEVGRRGVSGCAWLDDRRWRDCYEVTGGPTACIGRGCLVYPDGVAYAQGLEGAPSGPLDEALAVELIDSLSAMTRAVLEDLPPLSDVIATSSPDWGGGYETARLATEGVRRHVADRRRTVRDAVRALERDTVALASGLERARGLLRVIEESGGGFTTPLGPLPVGIRELVFLYPALLGVACFVCLAAFRRLLILRRVFHLLTVEMAGEEATRGPLSVALTAPLWYEPLESRRSQVGRVLLPLAPFAFMIWSYLALRLGVAGVVTAGDSRLAPVWYDLFFWTASIAVVVSFGRVVAAVRDYPLRPNGPDRPAGDRSGA